MPAVRRPTSRCLGAATLTQRPPSLLLPRRKPSQGKCTGSPRQLHAHGQGKHVCLHTLMAALLLAVRAHSSQSRTSASGACGIVMPGHLMQPDSCWCRWWQPAPQERPLRPAPLPADVTDPPRLALTIGGPRISPLRLAALQDLTQTQCRSCLVPDSAAGEACASEAAVNPVHEAGAIKHRRCSLQVQQPGSLQLQCSKGCCCCRRGRLDSSQGGLLQRLVWLRSPRGAAQPGVGVA